MDGWKVNLQVIADNNGNGPAECSFTHHPQHCLRLDVVQSLQSSRCKRPMSLSSTQSFAVKRGS